MSCPTIDRPVPADFVPRIDQPLNDYIIKDIAAFCARSDIARAGLTDECTAYALEAMQSVGTTAVQCQIDPTSALTYPAESDMSYIVAEAQDHPNEPLPQDKQKEFKEKLRNLVFSRVCQYWMKKLAAEGKNPDKNKDGKPDVLQWFFYNGHGTRGWAPIDLARLVDNLYNCEFFSNTWMEGFQKTCVAPEIDPRTKQPIPGTGGDVWIVHWRVHAFILYEKWGIFQFIEPQGGAKPVVGIPPFKPHHFASLPRGGKKKEFRDLGVTVYNAPYNWWIGLDKTTGWAR